MSFDSVEGSIEGGQPYKLYEFTLGTSLRWRYTDADRAIEYASANYESIAITNDGVRQTGETSAEELKITVPSELPVVGYFRITPPSLEMRVLVTALHHGEAEARVYFSGHVRGMRRKTAGTAQLLCQPDVASLDRAGLRLGWERGCTHTVYDEGCKVSSGLFAVASQIVTVTATTIEGSTWGLGDGYFSGGYIEWGIGLGELDRRGIEAHAGQVLTIVGGTHGIEAGEIVTAYPGCPRTIEVCNSRFNNKDNYGGVPHLPGKSPFDGDPVF